jgi:hypothetical protein
LPPAYGPEATLYLGLLLGPGPTQRPLPGVGSPLNLAEVSVGPRRSVPRSLRHQVEWRLSAPHWLVVLGDEMVVLVDVGVVVDVVSVVVVVLVGVVVGVVGGVVGVVVGGVVGGWSAS